MAKDEVKEEKMNPFMKNMLKGLIPMITGKLPEINGFLKKYLSEIELMERETKACILCMVDKTDTAQIITCTLNNDDTVTRIISKVSAVEFINTLLKNF
jgi:hypothetical protein